MPYCRSIKTTAVTGSRVAGEGDLMSADGERRARVALSFLAKPGDPVLGEAEDTARPGNSPLAGPAR
jgi:hypothetical protein